MDRANDHWYLAQLRPNGYRRARLNVERQGYGCFMPMRHVTERRRGKLQGASRPLFPGYLFIEVPPARQFWRTLNGTYGISRIVALEGTRPTQVPPMLMLSLFERCDGDLWSPMAEEFTPGTPVRLLAGPFAKALGTIDSLPDNERVYVLLTMMGHSVRMAVSTSHLELVSS
jgi:transcriptional antiterminator RfaH